MAASIVGGVKCWFQLAPSIGGHLYLLAPIIDFANNWHRQLFATPILDTANHWRCQPLAPPIVGVKFLSIIDVLKLQKKFKNWCQLALLCTAMKKPKNRKLVPVRHHWQSWHQLSLIGAKWHQLAPLKGPSHFCNIVVFRPVLINFWFLGYHLYGILSFLGFHTFLLREV